MVEERSTRITMFGREASFTYAENWVGYSLIGMRLVIAWVFLQSGIEKLLDGGISDPVAWSASGFFEHSVVEANPFYDVWMGMSGDPVVDALVIFGQLGIGIGLLLGALFRLAAFFGGLQMLLFWAASLEGGLMAGLPVDHGYVVSSHIVNIILLFGLGAFGAGRVLGVDSYIEDTNLFENNGWLRYLTG